MFPQMAVERLQHAGLVIYAEDLVFGIAHENAP
jgi:hypothetical protein